MAYIKVKWRKKSPSNRQQTASDYEKYLLRDRGTELIIHTYNCFNGHIIDDFIYTQSIFGKNTSSPLQNNIALEVIQSFSPNESSILTAKKVNSMGEELAKRYFPDHQFAVITHTDTSKLHNHILINPVNEITGKRDVHNKIRHLYSIRRISNEISLENGLTIINSTGKEQAQKVPDQAMAIEKRGGRSHRLDLLQKADFARSYATSFNEYTGVLNELSVKVAITDKSITYFYKGHQKGIRGRKLGDNYIKSGLIKKFKSNDKLFYHQPQLKGVYKDGIKALQDGKRVTLGATGPIFLDGRNEKRFGEKNYSSFTKSHRDFDRTPLPTNDNLAYSPIPIEVIRDASSRNISDYCKQHRIKLETNKKGQSVLAGREFVVIDKSRWVNTKNNTTGSLIEFVSIHQDKNYLQAISDITGNKRLLLLEQFTGEVKRPYNSFHVPFVKEENKGRAMKILNGFANINGLNQEKLNHFFKSENVGVDKSGSVWFFQENKKGAIEYFQDENGEFNSKTHGIIDGCFLDPDKAKNNGVTVYTSIMDFLKNLDGSKQTKKTGYELVLMGAKITPLCVFLAKNTQIKDLTVIESENKEVKNEQLNFVDEIKKKIKKFEIFIDLVSKEKALEKTKSIDFSF